MPDVTVRQLADVVGIPVDRLISQLGEAGLEAKDADATITDKEKMKLLAHLRKSHGKAEDTPNEIVEPKKITLKRRTVSELKQGGAGKSKTVNVEVRKKRTYVKRAVVQEEVDRQQKEKEAAEAEKIAAAEAEAAAKAAEEEAAAKEAEAYQDELASKLRRHDLTALTLQKPALIEKRVNNATAKIFDQLEIDTGRPAPAAPDSE